MNGFLSLMFALIPIVWFKYVNANYLTTKTFFLYFVSSLALLALPDNFSFRKFGKPLGGALLLLFIYQIYYYFFGPEWFNFFYFFKTLAFVAVAVYVYSLALSPKLLIEKNENALWLTFGAIVVITALEIFELRVLNGNIKTDIILGTFGNVNMASEFFVLSLPFLFLWVQRSVGWAKVLKFFVFFSVIFFILYGRSRSAWAGLALWGIFIFWSTRKKLVPVISGTALILFAVSHFTAGNTETISKLVPQAFSERRSLYQASLEMLAAKPTGIAPGQFMNEIVPYLIDKDVGPNEYAYFDQPHSEFLKWGVQYGWLYLGVALVVFALLAKQLVVRFRRNGLDSERLNDDFFIGSFLVFLPQAVFQFPFENPATILIIAVVFGLFLSSFDIGQQVSIRFFKPVIGVLAVVGMLNAFVYFTSVFFESAYPNSADLMSVVCRFHPVNFRACYAKNKDLLDIKNIPAFRSEFKNDFQKNMFYCDNLRMAVDYFNYSQNAKKTCEALQLYRLIYKNQRHFAPQSTEQCAGVASPFKFENPEQFKSSFLRWFVE